MENIKEEIENLLIDCIIETSQNRLVVFKPEKSEKDLIAKKKDDYSKKEIALTILDKNDDAPKTKSGEDGWYFVSVNFDFVSQKLTGDFVVSPSKKLGKGQAVKQKDFGHFLLEKLKKK